MPIQTFIIPFRINGTEITIPFQAICSVTKKLFRGKIIVLYQPRRKVVEYVDLEVFIKRISKRQQTAEELCHAVWKAVSKSISPSALRVVVDVTYSQAHRPARIWKESGFIK